jgi:hypothetical protein
MVSFRRIAFLLALTAPALIAAQAQSSSSTSDATATAQAQDQAPTPQQMSVQARIKARREKRRADAIHEAYGHLYEAYAGIGYLRFTPGAALQRNNEYAWDLGFTRYRSERLGITVDGRGTYGPAWVGVQPGQDGVFNPKISQYALMAGPTYRFYLQPKYAISGRVLGGFAYGNFSGDTSGLVSVSNNLGLYPDGTTYALNAAVIGEYNLTPELSFRLAPEYLATGFGSSIQNNLGFTLGVNYRFGKQ